MDPQILNKYLDQFGNLHRNMGTAPHKPVLLLSILDEINRGHIPENQIVLTLELVASFRENWDIFSAGRKGQRIWIPFYYLTGEKFWKLVKNGLELTPKQVGEPNSVNDMQKRVDYAVFAPDLWELLQDKISRTVLRQHLLQVYFGITPEQVQVQVPADPLEAQLQKLIAESESQPQTKKVKESADDTKYYVRHALFPQVIRAIYDDSCSICGLFVRTGKSSIIESAHIKPFADFHDDHPSNGIALCKDHHWGFDAGAFSITDEYTVVVSPHLQHTPGYVIPGDPIRLPSSENCYPSFISLANHRERTFLK